jgi:RND family efflux transporter MFP subunit
LVLWRKIKIVKALTGIYASLGWLFTRLRTSVVGAYAWFMRRTRKVKLGILFLIGAVLIGLVIFAGMNTPEEGARTLPAVKLKKIEEFSEAGGGASVFGTVRSVSEATILAETSGAVKSVRTTLGASVPAGFIIAELENASERASVLSAEGAYEAALAARASAESTTGDSVGNAYRSAFIALETTIENDIDLFFGNPTAYGPRLLITSGGDYYRTLPNLRRDLDTKMDAWRKNLELGALPPPQMLAEAERITGETSSLLLQLAQAANDKDSGAYASQLLSLASARASVDALLTSLSNVRNAYEADQTKDTTISASDAGVKQALGALRLAQANLEKTLIRAPIAGTVNYLPIRTGDFVTAFTHVATVARNGSLEIIANVSEENRPLLVVGQTLMVDTDTRAVITSIAPALNPDTKQIEIRLAVEEGDAESTLLNGASVSIRLPAAANVSGTDTRLLPLTAVKLLPDARVIFTLDAESRLAALPVQTGNVRGDSIEILSPIDASLSIVIDARGRFDGERVRVIEQTP